MDQSVIDAMARWPNVAAVYGWMSLDRRGRWCLQGEPVLHRGAIEFMNRNYECTEKGLWYFQNGSQRVFVDLDYTPWIYTLDGSRNLIDHTEKAVRELRGVWLDEEGNMLLMGERGIGLLCDQDLESVSGDLRFADDGICDEESIARLIGGGTSVRDERIYFKWHDRRIQIETILRGRVAGEFGFEPRPRAGGGDD